MKLAIVMALSLLAGCATTPPPVQRPCSPVPSHLVSVLPRPAAPVFLVPEVVYVVVVLHNLSIAMQAIDDRDAVIDQYEANVRQSAAQQRACR